MDNFERKVQEAQARLRYEEEVMRQELITDIGAALLRSAAILSALAMAVALGYGIVWTGALIGGWL